MQSIKIYGKKNTVIRFIKSILRNFGVIFESYIVFSFLSPNEKSISSPKIKGKVQILNYKDFSNSSEKYQFPNEKRLKKFLDRLKSGRHAIGFFSNKKLLYYCWLSLDNFEPKIFNQQLVNNQGMVFDVVCHPSFRRLGIHKYMTSYAINKAFEFGKSEVILLANTNNIAAIKSYENIGFKRKFLIKHRKFLNKNKVERCATD